jgi:hypothetical protein
VASRESTSSPSRAFDLPLLFLPMSIVMSPSGSEEVSWKDLNWLRRSSIRRGLMGSPYRHPRECREPIRPCRITACQIRWCGRDGQLPPVRGRGADVDETGRLRARANWQGLMGGAVADPPTGEWPRLDGSGYEERRSRRKGRRTRR